jgi:phosphinothricin acetyltransferase
MGTVTEQIRSGQQADLPALLAIYNHHVRTGHATFDEVEATLNERQRWFDGFQASGPHRVLVATVADDVLGYATSSPYRSHPAFDRTVETSIYLHPSAIGRGLGGRLYDAVLAELVGTSAVRVVAAVALPNDASLALHRSRGFEVVGTFTDYAIKRGRVLSSTWLQRPVSRQR